jgi:hypothetical protein
MTSWRASLLPKRLSFSLSYLSLSGYRAAGMSSKACYLCDNDAILRDHRGINYCELHERQFYTPPPEPPARTDTEEMPALQSWDPGFTDAGHTYTYEHEAVPWSAPVITYRVQCNKCSGMFNSTDPLGEQTCDQCLQPF